MVSLPLHLFAEITNLIGDLRLAIFQHPKPLLQGSLRPQRDTSFRTHRRHACHGPGRRRSLVNFHSFRRYFITKAEQADQMEHIIAVVVGHKRTGMTLGRYSGGPLLEQARCGVEAVKLP